MASPPSACSDSLLANGDGFEDLPSENWNSVEQVPGGPLTVITALMENLMKELPLLRCGPVILFIKQEGP